METRVSVMDPTPLVPAPSFSQLSIELLSIYDWMAKTHSHKKFVSICCRNHIISKGLQIKTQPCVPKSPCWELVPRLQKDWTRIIKKTCRNFLITLKLYHRGCAYNLWCQADDLKASSIEARFGKTRMTLMRKEAKAVYKHQNFYLWERRNNKLNKLYSTNSCTRKIEYQRTKRTRRQFRRKPHSYCNADGREVPTTVINLSSIHLSDNEVNLLSKELFSAQHLDKLILKKKFWII